MLWRLESKKQETSKKLARNLEGSAEWEARELYIVNI